MTNETPNGGRRASSHNKEKIMPTCTAADSVAENLTAVLTVLFFV